MSKPGDAPLPANSTKRAANRRKEVEAATAEYHARDCHSLPLTWFLPQLNLPTSRSLENTSSWQML